MIDNDIPNGNYIIFSIDNWQDIHVLSKFTHHLDVLRALNKLRGNVKTLIGSYKGQPEISFLLDSRDFADHVEKTHWVEGQESVLEVNPFCAILYGKVENGRFFTNNLGCYFMTNDVVSLPDFTYDPTFNRFFQLVNGGGE